MKQAFFHVGFDLMVIAFVMLILTTGFLKKTANEKVTPAGNGFAVVELFTSEGCSSCPPADAAIEKMAILYPGDVYVLAFHVDYWDRLGWKDEFSNAIYSERQRGYAGLFKLNSVYTPQVVINGREQFVGSDATRLRRSVEDGIKATANQVIELSAMAAAGKTVQVNYKLNAPSNTTLNMALIQIAAQTSVKRGENAGRMLHHINIIRDFKEMGLPGKPVSQSGFVNLALPGGMTAKECKVIAYLQQQHTREVTGVVAAFIK